MTYAYSRIEREAQAAAAKTRYLWACHVSCAAFFSDDPNAAEAERNATRAHAEWRAAVARLEEAR